MKSSIFKNPNTLSVNISLPQTGPSTIPPGIQNPRTFREIGAYLHSLLVTEINEGSNKYLIQTWRGKPQSFAKAYKAQFTAYSQGTYPFMAPLSVGQSPLEWWLAFEGTPNGGILAVSRSCSTSENLSLTLFFLGHSNQAVFGSPAFYG